MTCKSCKQEGHSARTCALRKKKQDGAGISNGGTFKGVGVYTNNDTGRTVIHPGTAFETVLHEGFRQTGSTQENNTTHG
ncbi:hypothetical protein LINGRAHAP2_LOCUS28970, partial [Linum grandiflorum]